MKSSRTPRRWKSIDTEQTITNLQTQNLPMFHPYDITWSFQSEIHQIHPNVCKERRPTNCSPFDSSWAKDSRNCGVSNTTSRNGVRVWHVFPVQLPSLGCNFSGYLVMYFPRIWVSRQYVILYMHVKTSYMLHDILQYITWMCIHNICVYMIIYAYISYIYKVIYLYT